MAPITTDSMLRAALKASGMTMRKENGEYRVAPCSYAFPQLSPAEREAMAYYTDNRDDAAATGAAMNAQLRGY